LGSGLFGPALQPPAGGVGICRNAVRWANARPDQQGSGFGGSHPPLEALAAPVFALRVRQERATPARSALAAPWNELLRPVLWQPAFRLQPNSPLVPRRHSGADSKKSVNSISYMRKGPNCGPHAFLAIPSSASKRTCAPLATPGISRVEKLPGQNHILPR
jgi:hypothetical protein